jgi:ketosteroid isomerase-like protein
MTADNKHPTDEARIRELIEERVRAIRAKDVDALMSAHAPDVVFDALDPLRYVGAEAVGECAAQWLSWYEGPIGYEVRDLSVTAGGRLVRRVMSISTWFSLTAWASSSMVPPRVSP